MIDTPVISNKVTTFLFPSACGLPLYESSGVCVETCPSGQTGVGNVTTLTGTCQQCEY